MSDRKPEDIPSTSQMKKRRINEEEQQSNEMVDEAQNQTAVAAVPNEENAGTQIFKLDVDCVQETLDWLSIEDIHSVSETCTRMQRIVGDYFQPNLTALELLYRSCEIKMFYDGGNLSGFKEFARKLDIGSSADDNVYQFIGLNFKSLKQIAFWSDLNRTKIEYIKPILSKIETVRFFCDVGGEFYESFLQFCPKLKYLNASVFSLNEIIGASNAWLCRSYPTLEHLKLELRVEKNVPELGTFFEQNSNLQKLSLDGKTFLRNIDTLLQARIKLQMLGLKVTADIETICRQLNKLYDKGFYRRLSLQFCDDNNNDVQPATNGISSLNVGGLEIMHFRLSSNTPRLNLDFLTSLKELGLNNMFACLTPLPIDIQSTAKSLVNLERLYLSGVKSESIDPFIQYSAKLKAIKIHWLRDEFTDLSALNKKREQLAGARKVIVYLEGEAFVNMKWRNKTIDLKMIELRRIESTEWECPI